MRFIRRSTLNARVILQGNPTPVRTYRGSIIDQRLIVPRSERIHFDGASLHRVDLSGQTFRSYQAQASTFVECDYSRCVWQSGVLGHTPPARYVECDFSDADLRSASPQFARFERCTFANARLDDWDGLCAEFIDCTFAGRIVGATFSGQPWGFCRPYVAPRAANDFRGNDFTDAVLEECSFLGGIDLGANTFPDSDDYLVIHDLPAALAGARSRLNELDGSDVPYASGLLLAYSSGGFAIQRDLFVRKADLGPLLPLLLMPSPTDRVSFTNAD